MLRNGARGKRSLAIVGAGLGGLSCAVRLAHAGYRVDVYEQQESTGGKASTRQMGHFRFDTGPSLFTMPDVFKQLFDEVGESMEDYLRIVPLDPICTYFYPDGTVLENSSDLDRFSREIEEKTEDSAEAVMRFIRYGRGIYETAADLFLWNDLRESLLDAFRRPCILIKSNLLCRLAALWSIDAHRTMDAANRSFFQDPRMVQFFDRYATYNGSNPYRVPATLNIIPYVEYGMGGYALEGGIHALPLALTRLAEEKGVHFHLGTRVDRIIHENGKIRGVEANGLATPYDVVVSNVDILSTYNDLLRDQDSSWIRRYNKLEPSSSGLVFLWGIEGRFDRLTVNNIFFSKNYREEFADIFERKICPADPTVYVNITSKTTPQDAPQGGENWFVLINAPYDQGQNWLSQTETSRERVLRRIERALGQSVEDRISVEYVMTPRDIERTTSSSRGSLYGISSNTPLAAFLRHPNRVGRYRGLYFCGGSAHPGGGMPLVVLSGKIASDLVRRHDGLT